MTTSDTLMQDNLSNLVGDRGKALLSSFTNVDNFIAMCFVELAGADCQHHVADEDWKSLWLRTVDHGINIMQSHVKVKTEEDWNRRVQWHKTANERESVPVLRKTVATFEPSLAESGFDGVEKDFGWWLGGMQCTLTCKWL